MLPRLRLLVQGMTPRCGVYMRWATLTIIFLVLLSFYSLLIKLHERSTKMAVVHVVLFQFKEGTPPDKVQEV